MEAPVRKQLPVASYFRWISRQKETSLRSSPQLHTTSDWIRCDRPISGAAAARLRRKKESQYCSSQFRRMISTFPGLTIGFLLSLIILFAFIRTALRWI